MIETLTVEALSGHPIRVANRVGTPKLAAFIDNTQNSNCCGSTGAISRSGAHQHLEIDCELTW